MPIALKKDALAVGRKDGGGLGGVAGAVLAQGQLALDRADQQEDVGRCLAPAGAGEHGGIGIPAEVDVLRCIGDWPVLVRIGIKLANIVERFSAFGEVEVEDRSPVAR